MPGFRKGSIMVSNWWMRARASLPAHQSKIYGESNRADFSRFFAELSPMQ
jgi:hypothetical protein